MDSHYYCVFCKSCGSPQGSLNSDGLCVICEMKAISREREKELRERMNDILERNKINISNARCSKCGRLNGLHDVSCSRWGL